MRSGVVLAMLVTLPACDTLFLSKHGPDAAVPPDQPVPLYAVPHLDDPIALGEGDFILDGGTINTATDSIGGAQPGVAHRIVPMSTGGEALLVRARSVRLSGTVTVRGDKPLIVFAESIVITGVLDGSADGTTDGPGASTSGAGMMGATVETNNAGSGGGGFGASGGIGGQAGTTPCPRGVAAGGEPGNPFGEATLMTLVGGGRGGDGGGNVQCPTTRGGGGGGAIQLSATTQITVQGTIDVGGGGGAGGATCVTPERSRSGAGGGAGGALYLDAPMIEVPGVLAANGGGGGSGGTTPMIGSCTSYVAGNPGADASTSTTPAAGGPLVDDPVAMTCSRAGGEGGAAGVAAASGVSLNCDGSAGGGGGGVGRIVLRGAVGTTNVITPAPTSIDP